MKLMVLAFVASTFAAAVPTLEERAKAPVCAADDTQYCCETDALGVIDLTCTPRESRNDPT